MIDEMGAACPHCGQANPPVAQFCGSCGLAMPIAGAGPRVISGKGGARTAVGMKLQADELLNTARRAARTLLTIGIINLAFGALDVPVLMRLPPTVAPYMTAIIASMMIAGALYVGMFFWARFDPLPAMITGLAVYVAKWGVDLAIRVTFLPRTTRSVNLGTYGFLRFIMMIYLIRGVIAAVKHRRLLREQAQESTPMPVLPVG